MNNQRENKKYVEKLKSNIEHVFKNKPSSFIGEHLPKFEKIAESLESQLNNEIQIRTQSDRTVIYAVHMAKFRRVARSIGLMKPRIRTRSRK